MSPALFGALVAAAIVVGIGAVAVLTWLMLRTRSEGHLRRRLNPDEEVEPLREFGPAPARPLIENMARSGRAIEKVVDTEGETAQLLVRAGWRQPQARVGWYVFQGVLPLVLFGAVAFFWTFAEADNRLLMAMLLAMIAAILSFLMPRWVLRWVAAQRVRRIRHEVPLLIHLLVLLFESGLSTRQALASIVREGEGVLPEIGREFDTVIRQIEAGADIGELLESLAETLDIDDLSGVLGILRQVDRYGGELREPLLETLKVIEERRGYEIRELVNLLSGRMTVVMVLFFFPALMIFVAGPAFLSIISALTAVGN